MTNTAHDLIATARQHLAEQDEARLVELAETATAQRDAAPNGDLFADYARVLGFVWDELDVRMPSVLEAWDAAAEASRDVDLTAMYRAEVGRP